VSVAEVFFATIAAGGGHVATARALAEALGSRHPGRFTTTVSDVMAELGFEALDARHKAGWRALLKRPRLVRLGQRATDAVPRLSRAAQNAMLDGFAEEAARRLDALSPALVVANHGWLATALTRAQRRYGMRSRLVVFATEPFDASALWAEPHAEVVVAPSAAARADLVRLGVPPERVHVLGYPVREAFLRPPAREAARGELGLGDELTCLLSLGAEGVAGEALAIAELLARRGVRVLAVAGRNERLRAGFEGLAARQPEVTPFGFTDRMPTLLAAADVVVGKAGPASTMEALAVGRPLIVTAYAGLNEARVVRFLQARGLGSYAPDPQRVAGALERWRDPAALERAAEAAARLDFPGMSARLAGFLARLAGGEAPPAAAAPVGAFEAVSTAELAGRPVPDGEGRP